jgi:hypothetical protein
VHLPLRLMVLMLQDLVVPQQPLPTWGQQFPLLAMQFQ